MLILS
jgi:hypothetical protein